MPLQKSNEGNYKKVFLPSSKDLAEDQKEWVVLEVGPMMGADMLEADTFDKPIGFKFEVLISRMQEWNVRDTDGEVAKMTPENIKRLNVEDLAYLITHMESKDDEEKAVPDPKVSPVGS